MRSGSRVAVVVMCGACLAGVASACGTSAGTTVAVQPTVTTLPPPSPTVPAFGAPASVLPATAANAMLNASGACSEIDLVYVQAAQTHVASEPAQADITMALQFAQAAATGAPGQWGVLRADTQAVLATVTSGAWDEAASQDAIPAVSTVYQDCRPLQ
jgi:hypothetical protein